jgi:hypothetical protein
MVLNNYYNMCKQLYAQIGTPTGPEFAVPVKLTNGSSSTSYGRSRDPMIFFLNTLASSYVLTTLPGSGTRQAYYIHIVFGTNDTPPTPDDYTTDAIAGINYVSGTITAEDENKGKLTVIFKNNNSSSITIKDVLICGCAEVGNNYVVHPAIYREVFPQPITVEAGQHFTFSLTKSYGE